MTENNSDLILRFEKITKNEGEFDVPVPVSVQFRNASAVPYKFVNPISDKELASIRWYVEMYAGWFSEEQKGSAEDVETMLPQIGQRLFDAVFKGSPDATSIFRDFDNIRKQCGGNLVIDTNEPSILRLPWELLRDEGGYLFRKNPPISVHRRMRQTHQITMKPFQPPIRILMIVSRPEDATFIDSRTIAVPLIDALDGLNEQVEIEFLRPPTLPALDARLHNTDLPPIHIVHFDGHGVYDQIVGLGFLLFEDDKFKAHRVDSDKLGNLLYESGIPLVVLNACQSAKPDDRNPFASVASRLIESGIGGVVAMNYSVLVETAKLFAGDFYGELANGQSVALSIDIARRCLYSNSKRGEYRKVDTDEIESVHLQDWFLPALYQQADELIPFAPLSPSTVPSSKGKGAGGIGVSRAKFPPAPLHGFHGRARELLDLERAFATRNIVVLHGFGGQGKTSLATQAAEWFTRTRLFERAAFISFETGASLDFVLNELGNALVEENFQIHQGDKVEAIAQSLKEKPALVVFDNFESALPDGNAPMGELQMLLDAASKWFGDDGGRRTEDRASVSSRSSVLGQSRLLITTRNTDIPHPAFTPGTNCLHKELSGLAPSDALELAASILEAYSLPRPPRLPLEELLAFLKGHPLSLQLALPQLRDYSAEKLVEQYQSILPHMKKGEAKERNESLEVSLRFSLDRLGADALNWLSRLWIFEGGAMEHVLLMITEIPEEAWNALKPQLTSTALIRVEEIPSVTVPFIHFHPTLAPYLKAINDNSETDNSILDNSTAESRISNIEERYWQIYYSYANQLARDDVQHPIPVRSIVLRELPNLKRALKRTLAAGALDEAVDFAARINRFLDAFGRWRERDEVAAEVEKVISNQSSVSSGKITKREFMMESGRGERLLQQGRAAEAEKVFRALLARLEGDAEYDTRYDHANLLGYVGRTLRIQGKPSSAVEFHRKAVIAWKTLEQDEQIIHAAAVEHTDLADVLRELGLYAESRSEYEISLELAKKVNDDRQQGVALGQLGTLAMMQGDLNEARKRHLEALRLFQRMGEDQMETVAWHQLGMVAQEARDWDEAERCYKQALTMRENYGDLALAATDCNQLAIVAKNAERPQEAERWYMRAIELGEKLGDRQGLAKRLNNLADLYLSQNRLDEAEEYARRALAIMETLDLSSEPWKTYNILAQIAEKRGRMDEAREWRRKEQESFAAFAGSDNEIKEWLPIIKAVVAACQGNEEAQNQLEPFLQKQSQTDDWRNLIAVIHRIINGERDGNIVEGLDRIDAVIVTRILQALNGEQTEDGGRKTEEDGPRSSVNGQAQPPSPRPSPKQGEGVTLPQLLDLVERAAKGDKELGGQLFTAFQQMSRAEDATMSALGNVLLRVLVGEREPDLSKLPDELASAVRGLLGRLKNK